MRKSTIPLSLMRVVEPIALKNLDIIQFVPNKYFYYQFVEPSDPDNIYFKIYIDGRSHIEKFDNKSYLIVRKPHNIHITDNQTFSVVREKPEMIVKTLEDWLVLVREIIETPSVYDDNFVKKYSEYYYNQFEIVDKDAHITPFDPHQQDLIESTLKSLTLLIESSEVELDENFKKEIIEEIETIRVTLPIITKKQVIKKISTFLGKMYKESKNLTRNEMLPEFRKLMYKGLYEKGWQLGESALVAFKAYLEQ